MHSEDRLDALLSDDTTFEGQRAQLTQQYPDVAPLLIAAAQLRPLRAQQPNPAYARSLEAQLIERASALRAANAPSTSAPQHTAPTLAGRAYAADGDAPTIPGIVSLNDARAGGARWPVAPTLTPARRAARQRRGSRVRIWWPAVAAAVAILLGGGALTAAASAGPGSPLFALHQLERGVQANISSPADRVRADLQASDTALAALDTAAAQHGANDDSAYTDALTRLLSEQQGAAHDLADVPGGAEHDALSAQVSAARARTRAALHASLRAPGVLNWGNRLAASQGLSALGESIPVITRARIESPTSGTDANDATSHSGDARWRVTLSGSGFLPGASLIVNGHPVPAEITSVAEDQLVALAHPDSDLQASEGIRHITSIGVLNSDGTAASTTQIDLAANLQSTPPTTPGTNSNGSHDSGGSGSGHGGAHDPTPTPSPTPPSDK